MLVVPSLKKTLSVTIIPRSLMHSLRNGHLHCLSSVIGGITLVKDYATTVMTDILRFVKDRYHNVGRRARAQLEKYTINTHS